MTGLGGETPGFRNLEWEKGEEFKPGLRMKGGLWEQGTNSLIRRERSCGSEVNWKKGAEGGSLNRVDGERSKDLLIQTKGEGNRIGQQLDTGSDLVAGFRGNFTAES